MLNITRSVEDISDLPEDNSELEDHPEMHVLQVYTGADLATDNEVYGATGDTVLEIKLTAKVRISAEKWRHWCEYHSADLPSFVTDNLSHCLSNECSEAMTTIHDNISSLLAVKH